MHRNKEIWWLFWSKKSNKFNDVPREKMNINMQAYSGRVLDGPNTVFMVIKKRNFREIIEEISNAMIA